MNPVDKWTKKWKSQLTKACESTTIPKSVLHFFTEAQVVGLDVHSSHHKKAGILKSSEISFEYHGKEYLFRFFETETYVSPIRLDGQFQIEVDGSQQIRGQSLGALFEVKGNSTKEFDDVLKKFIHESKKAKDDFQSLERKKKYQIAKHKIGITVVEIKEEHPLVYVLADGTELVEKKAIL